jgi:prolyl-tRNA synthetase
MTCFTTLDLYGRYSNSSFTQDQAAAGIFYLLPLGLRVQEKICGFADDAMKQMGIVLCKFN